MLVLNRTTAQRIVIGEDVEVTVLAVKGKRVTLGVRAPRAIRVLRHELQYKATDTEQPSDSESTAPESKAPHRDATDPTSSASANECQ
jgi:carbon storage regulator